MTTFRFFLIYCLVASASFRLQGQPSKASLEKEVLRIEQQVYHGFLEEAYRIAEIAGNHEKLQFSNQVIAAHLLTSANVLNRKGQESQGLILLDSALHFIADDDYVRRGVYNMEKGYVYRYLLQFDSSLWYYKEAERVFEHLPDNNEWLTLLKIELGYYFQQKTERDKALSIFEEVLSVDSSSVGALLGKSMIHLDREHFEVSRKYYSKAERLEAPMSDAEKTMLGYLKSSYYRQIGQQDSAIFYNSNVVYFGNFGWLFFENGNYDSARYYFKKEFERFGPEDKGFNKMNALMSLACVDVIGNKIGEESPYIQELQRDYSGIVSKNPTYALLLSNIAYNEGDYEKSFKDYAEFLYSDDFNIEPQVAISTLNHLKNLYPKLENYDNAMRFHEIFVAKVNTSIREKFDYKQANAFERLNELNAVLLETGIEVSETRNRLKLEEQRTMNLRLTVLFVIIVSLVLAYLIFYAYQSQKKIRSFNEQLESNNMVLDAANHDKEMLLVMITHQIKSPFANIIYFLDLCGELIRENKLGDMKELLDSLSSVTNASYQRVLNVLAWQQIVRSSDLKTEFVDFQVLINKVLNFYQAEITQKKIGIDLSIPNDLSLNANKEGLTIILQNLVENAVKYADRKSEVSIRLSTEARTLTLVVENDHHLLTEINSHRADGVPKSGLGLTIVRELCEKLNISLNYQHTDSATLVSLGIPHIDLYTEDQVKEYTLGA